jgi:hypothetical protein
LVLLRFREETIIIYPQALVDLPSYCGSNTCSVKEEQKFLYYEDEAWAAKDYA